MRAGEGRADLTPPLGIELAGFHKPPGQERVVVGLRQASEARALALEAKGVRAALVSLDLCGISSGFAKRAKDAVSKVTGIPATHVRLCATHTHTMPTLRALRQWGGVSKDYEDVVEKCVVEAVDRALRDLAEADFYVGRERVHGGNSNRTGKAWKTDEAFGRESTDRERWLDTSLHVLHFLREKPRRSLLWYQFSAHPVCFRDGRSGPDWPGLVARKMQERDGLSPSLLQGHCGDVNPGPGKPWIGDPEETSEAVVAALHHATTHSRRVEVREIKLASAEVGLPLDLESLQKQLDQYRADPSKCVQGEWVDAEFSKDWFRTASTWDPARTSYPALVTAMALGPLGLLFHPAELYSYYGLAIQRGSPFAQTVVVGYADDLVGYLTDPAAYEAREYAAIVVPKIFDLPPFRPEAAATLTAEAATLLKKLA